MRIGYKNRPFRLIKFRTMLTSSNLSTEPLTDSERLTKFGIFLRNTSLDELPELLNIFIGDMNIGYIVNPRTNLKIFANITYRSFNPDANTVIDFKENTTWFNFGIRTDIFNWYFDF